MCARALWPQSLIYIKKFIRCFQNNHRKKIYGLSKCDQIQYLSGTMCKLRPRLQLYSENFSKELGLFFFILLIFRATHSRSFRLFDTI